MMLGHNLMFHNIYKLVQTLLENITELNYLIVP